MSNDTIQLREISVLFVQIATQLGLHKVTDNVDWVIVLTSPCAHLSLTIIPTDTCCVETVV